MMKIATATLGPRRTSRRDHQQRDENGCADHDTEQPQVLIRREPAIVDRKTCERLIREANAESLLEAGLRFVEQLLPHLPPPVQAADILCARPACVPARDSWAEDGACQHDSNAPHDQDQTRPAPDSDQTERGHSECGNHCDRRGTRMCQQQDHARARADTPRKKTADRTRDEQQERDACEHGRVMCHLRGRNRPQFTLETTVRAERPTRLDERSKHNRREREH